MEKILLSFLFENQSVEIDEKFLENIVEFALRSFYGVIGSALIDYEILKISPELCQLTLKSEKKNIQKISSALCLINSYGVTRVKIISMKLPNITEMISD